MRLRDIAITKDDYELWQTHSLDGCDAKHDAPWPGGENLLREAIYLVADNTQAGIINGHRLASRAPSLQEPNYASSLSVVVRCEAKHNNERGANRKADAFRNVRKALHVCWCTCLLVFEFHLGRPDGASWIDEWRPWRCGGYPLLRPQQQKS